MQAYDFGQQVEQLGAADKDRRHAAFTVLQQEGKAAVEALIAGTAHPNWRVRRGCADLMDHLADNRCVEPLLRLLHDPIEAVRRLALHALGCQGCKVCPLDVDIVAHLVRLAQTDSSIRVRRVAVHQLGCQPPDTRAMQVLETILAQETDSKLLSRARWALSQQQRSD
jgi:HEAT repeat protein